MLNFGLSAYLTEKTTTVVTSLSEVWLRTLFISWGHHSSVIIPWKYFVHIIIATLQKKQQFPEVSFSKAAKMQ
jgi:hypothetical protein